MKQLKGYLKTIRLSKQEEKKVSLFVREHPYLGHFSTVMRAALWEFMNGKRSSTLPSERPSFLWEYSLSPGEIQEILSGPQKKRLWLVAKILEHARWDEIWNYLTVDQIARDLPYLRLPQKTKAHWQYTLNRWRMRP